jgi:hypothetical protein
VPENVLDGDLGTRWSASGDGEWLRFDLGTRTTVGCVRVAWYRGDERQADFEVQVSEDDATWTSLLPRRLSSGSRTNLERACFTDRSMRYVRIVGHGNTSNDWNSITEVEIEGPHGQLGCERPAQLLDLTSWKLQLPDPRADGTSGAEEVKQPELNTYVRSPWFRVTSVCSAVQFRSPVNGETTTNSHYSRSELREMSPDGTGHAAWSSDTGVHTLYIEQAIKRLPLDKPHVIAGQIHDGDDVVSVRLRGSELYIGDRDTARYHLITDDYELGTKFTIEFVVHDGQVDVYYNGEPELTIVDSFSDGYFKAGVYTLANCDNSSPCDENNHGEVLIYDVRVTHSLPGRSSDR